MTIPCAELSALILKRPCSPDFDPTAASTPDNALLHKRQRIDASPRCLPPPCPLEELPTDILQQIFFSALNGNLLRASPRIGLKLSIQSVYRTAFFVAFYHQNLADLRKMYTYLLPEMPLSIPYWELRSMVKIVLDSRWCTWHWFKEIHLDLLAHALDRFDQIPNLKLSEISAETRRAIRDRTADCYDLVGRVIHGKLKDGRTFELDCSPDYICISEYPAELLGKEAVKIQVPVATNEWHLRLFAFGTIPMEVDITLHDEGEKAPFPEAVKGAIQLKNLSHTKPQGDLWALSERCQFAAVHQNDIPRLRRFLQIDYFFYPEDVPYKITPTLFRAAIKSEHRDSEGLPPLSALALLFDLDPQSLPYDSAIMKEWAQFNIDRICENREELLQSFSYLKSRQAGNNPFSESGVRNFVRQRRVAAYMDKTYRDIIRYMRDGVIPEQKNLLSPSFQGPVFNDDVETFMKEEEQAINAALPSHQFYLNMTVSALRDELSYRGISPNTVGRGKEDYVDRLMREDREGNRHEGAEAQAWGYADYDCFGDEDLEGLLEFVRSLPNVNSDPSDSLFENELIEDGASEEEDGFSSGEEEEGFSSGDESYGSINPNLDYVPELVDKYGGALDRKADYVWFEDPA